MRFLIAAMAAALTLLGGCTQIQDSIHPGEIAIIEANWMKPEIGPRPAALYCYRTLGRQDCYRSPVEDADRRLVEHYGPPPGVLGY